MGEGARGRFGKAQSLDTGKGGNGEGEKKLTANNYKLKASVSWILDFGSWIVLEF